MEFISNPYIATTLVGGGIFLVSYSLGRNQSLHETEEIIETTINHLIAGGYLKSKTNEDGELVLIKYKE